MDTCKLTPGLYQYTAVDDCTRWLVVAIYPRRTAANTLDFIECMVEQIQRFQTGNGREFTAPKVQNLLLEWGIKFRPSRPAAPHLNGKVEHVQKTVLEAFQVLVDLAAADLHDPLEQ